jgi:hypothetical protein
MFVVLTLITSSLLVAVAQAVQVLETLTPVAVVALVDFVLLLVEVL